MLTIYSLLPSYSRPFRMRTKSHAAKRAKREELKDGDARFIGAGEVVEWIAQDGAEAEE